MGKIKEFKTGEGTWLREEDEEGKTIREFFITKKKESKAEVSGTEGAWKPRYEEEEEEKKEIYKDTFQGHEGKWVTLEGGQHLFIREGESIEDSINRLKPSKEEPKFTKYTHSPGDLVDLAIEVEDVGGDEAELNHRVDVFNKELKLKFESQDEIYRNVNSLEAVDDVMENKIVRNKGSYAYLSFTVDQDPMDTFGNIRMVFDKEGLEGDFKVMEYGKDAPVFAATEEEVSIWSKNGPPVAKLRNGIKRIEVIISSKATSADKARINEQYEYLQKKYPKTTIIKTKGWEG